MLISLELLALLQSCTRIEPVEEPVVEDIDAITFAPGINSTKSLLNSLNGRYTRIQVYDYLSGFDGTINNTTVTPSQTIKYFSHVIAYDEGTTTYWPYWNSTSGAPDPTIVYPWTKSGMHSFFGWLIVDGSTEPNEFATALFKPNVNELSFNEETRVLTVPSTTLTITNNTPQFDLSYSDVEAVDASNRPSSTVPLHLKHFFGAIGITLTNNSENDVKVYSVQLKNFPNVGSGTITFPTGADSSVEAVYATPALSGTYDYWPNKITTPITLYNINHADGGKVYDVSTNNRVLGEDQDPYYFLAWPMMYSSLEPIVDTSVPVSEDGVVTYTSTSPLIEVKYGDMNSTAQTAKTYYYRFPKVTNPATTGAIIAGKKYSLDLSFVDHQVVVSFNQLPWTYDEYPMAYESDAISTTQLKFTENTYVAGAKYTDPEGVRHDVIQLTSASTAGQYIAKGTFKAYTPVNGLLTVTMSGNTEDFIVTLDSGLSSTGVGQGSETITINPHRYGGQITLTVRPRGTPSSGSRIFLHFAVRNNGRDSDADTEINRDNYMITIP